MQWKLITLALLVLLLFWQSPLVHCNGDNDNNENKNEDKNDDKNDDKNSDDKNGDDNNVNENHNKGRSCMVPDTCYFIERFETKNDRRWVVSDNTANPEPFNAGWSAKNSRFGTKKGEGLAMILDNKQAAGKPFAGSQIMTKKWHGYGCYEVRMRPALQAGVVTAFFSYTGPFQAAPGAPEEEKNEVDIELLWRPNPERVVLQTNYFTNGEGNNEHLVELPEDAATVMHDYAFRWNSNGIEWFVDGNSVHKATKNTPKMNNNPQKIFMNMWPVTDDLAEWAGLFRYSQQVVTQVGGVRFTSGENCAIYKQF